MRFHFVSYPITKKEGGKEEISISFRDSNHTGITDASVLVTWQRGPKEDWSHPYAELIGEPRFILAQTRILRALDAFCDNGEIDLIDPDQVLVHIERAKGEQVVLINREYVPTRKIDGDTPKFAALAKDNSHLLVVAADDEEDAKKVAGRQLMAMTDDDADIVDQVTAWMKSGKPVKKIEKDGNVKIHPLDAYCKRGHQRAAAEKKEADKGSGKKLTISGK